MNLRQLCTQSGRNVLTGLMQSMTLLVMRSPWSAKSGESRSAKSALSSWAVVLRYSSGMLPSQLRDRCSVTKAPLTEVSAGEGDIVSERIIELRKRRGRRDRENVLELCASRSALQSAAQRANAPVQNCCGSVK